MSSFVLTSGHSQLFISLVSVVQDGQDKHDLFTAKQFTPGLVKLTSPCPENLSTWMILYSKGILFILGSFAGYSIERTSPHSSNEQSSHRPKWRIAINKSVRFCSTVGEIMTFFKQRNNISTQLFKNWRTRLDVLAQLENQFDCLDHLIRRFEHTHSHSKRDTVY